jgi:predicted transcriptional regulator
MADPASLPEHDDPDAEASPRAVADGLASLDAGRGVPYENVRRWLLSWGTESELHPPECK